MFSTILGCTCTTHAYIVMSEKLSQLTQLTASCFVTEEEGNPPIRLLWGGSGTKNYSSAVGSTRPNNKTQTGFWVK